MDYFFYNTDSKSLRGQDRSTRYQILIQQGIAATSGARRYGEKLGELSPKAILLMYQNGRGVVAIGEVEEIWDRKTHNDSNYYRPGDVGFHPRDHQEYRIKVDWFSKDLKNEAIGLDKLRRAIRSPRFTPLAAIQES
jgi:hypothetical protein